MGHLELSEAATGDWSGRRVLVTGAAGLLGRAVCAELDRRGATVLGLDIAWAGFDGPAPRALTQVDGDIRDRPLVERILREDRPDTLIHLAAQTLVGPAVEDPIDTFSHNVEGSWTILDACRTVGSPERIVVASSDKAYGDAGGRPYVETMALRPDHPYDASKAMTDLLARTYARTYGLPVAITRCANLYGGGDLNWSRIVPGTIRSVLENEAPVIRSDGTFVRDYLFVDDAARAVLVLAEAVGRREEIRGEAFNFAAGQRLTAIEMAERILRVMGSSLRPRILATSRNEVPVQRVSAARARRELGWRPTVTLERGLAQTIEWYRGHLARAAR
ncbi:MAG TPA: NAD-dependent epimerase/dehydratase family protein [Candidatus Limnocylindrales bacterium]|nr:NAD-dependent epimerase/dehydratase family protein [Candidatus Limnocylindrales bacterium]